MIKGVIFDFDGVIVDSEYISYECYRDFLENYNISFYKDDYIEHCPGKTLVTTMNFLKNIIILNMILVVHVLFFEKENNIMLIKME